MSESTVKIWNHADRRHFIGGSDARTIICDDERALLRVPREKRGEVEPEDLSGNLIVQLGGFGTETHAGTQPVYSAFRFFGLPPFSLGSLSRISNIAVVRRRMASDRDGRSGCLRRHSSTRSKNSSESRI
jgi:hypothetical protein